MALSFSRKSELYRIYRKRKPNGKFRIIHAPCEELKELQKECAKYVVDMFETPECVFGFVEGRSAVDAAKLHTGKDWIIAMDIEDFFPSFTKTQLITAGIPETIAEICTLDEVLIQGSPASPVLTNYMFRHLDNWFQTWAKIAGITYTRYADDITLSGMGKPKWEYVYHIGNEIKCLNLSINKKKTKFMFKHQEQNVLGITVNAGVSINHKVRKAFKNKMKYEEITDKEMGYLSYVSSVNKKQFNRLNSLI